jgi:predicted dehydrogenase
VNVAIIGCGLIGQKRADALTDGHRLVAVVDRLEERAHRLAARWPGCSASTDARAALERADVDLIVVATTNDALASLTLAAIERDHHVLVEKPAARNAGELAPVMAAAQDRRVIVKVGFNHRFHPAFLKAREIFDSGVTGPLMYIRARYGHGGRVGYEREWRADPSVAGGGELLDQGVHLIDLARWFAGEFVEVSGRIGTLFWRMPVEDNGFLHLATASGQVAWLHASCTEWKNLFSFEIVCRDAKLQIDGLGGSYGVERLTFYRMLPAMGPPETTIWEYPGADGSWRTEFLHLVESIQTGHPPSGSLSDAHAALRIVDTVYAQHAAATGSRAGHR